MHIVSTNPGHAIRRNLSPAGNRRRRPVSPALAGMMMALAFLSREPLLVALRRVLFRPRRSPLEQTARLLSLPSLRSAILGRGQRSIVNMFGLPRAATGGQRPVWYYPVQADQRLAMAISFDEQRAAAVEFFHAP